MRKQEAVMLGKGEFRKDCVWCVKWLESFSYNIRELKRDLSSRIHEKPEESPRGEWDDNKEHSLFCLHLCTNSEHLTQKT